MLKYYMFLKLVQSEIAKIGKLRERVTGCFPILLSIAQRTENGNTGLWAGGLGGLWDNITLTGKKGKIQSKTYGGEGRFLGG